MKQKQPDPIIETIFETEKRLKRKANVILKEAKETEAVKLKNGFHWVIIDRKTTVLRKIKKIMKYTKEQAKKLKNKGMDGFTKYNRPLPDIEIVDGFYIVPSKMNSK